MAMGNRDTLSDCWPSFTIRAKTHLSILDVDRRIDGRDRFADYFDPVIFLAFRANRIIITTDGQRFTESKVQPKWEKLLGEKAPVRFSKRAVQKDVLIDMSNGR